MIPKMLRHKFTSVVVVFIYVNTVHSVTPLTTRLVTAGFLTPTYSCIASAPAYIYYNAYALTGTVPSAIFPCTQLTQFVVYNMKLSGTIPTEVGFATNVVFLGMDHCKMTGTIPSQLGLLNMLHTLYLETNNLVGTMPPDMFKNPLFKLLWLHRNKLTGSVPTTVGYMTRLKEIYMYNNELVGTIPTILATLPLKYLDLSINKLTGPIPSGVIKAGSGLYLMGNQLCDDAIDTMGAAAVVSKADSFGYASIAPYPVCKICPCNGGTAAQRSIDCSGSGINGHGFGGDTNQCVSCTAGYAFNSNSLDCTTTSGPICTCSNGTPETSSACTVNGNVQCASCNLYYHLTAGVGSICAANTCTCQNGIPPTLCIVHTSSTCDTCNANYHLVGNNCVANVCVCTGGSPDITTCSVHASEKCSSCNIGYHLNAATKTCIANVCTCDDSAKLPATGTDCTEDQGNICSNCPAYQHFGNSTCVPNICVCANGTPVSNGACQSNGSNKCDSCDNEYQLDSSSTVCESLTCIPACEDTDVCISKQCVPNSRTIPTKIILDSGLQNDDSNSSTIIYGSVVLLVLILLIGMVVILKKMKGVGKTDKDNNKTDMRLSNITDGVRKLSRSLSRKLSLKRVTTPDDYYNARAKSISKKERKMSVKEKLEHLVQEALEDAEVDDEIRKNLEAANKIADDNCSLDGSDDSDHPPPPQE